MFEKMAEVIEAGLCGERKKRLLALLNEMWEEELLQARIMIETEAMLRREREMYEAVQQFKNGDWVWFPYIGGPGLSLKIPKQRKGRIVKLQKNGWVTVRHWFRGDKDSWSATDLVKMTEEELDSLDSLYKFPFWKRARRNLDLRIRGIKSDLRMMWWLKRRRIIKLLRKR